MIMAMMMLIDSHLPPSSQPATLYNSHEQTSPSPLPPSPPQQYLQTALAAEQQIQGLTGARQDAVSEEPTQRSAELRPHAQASQPSPHQNQPLASDYVEAALLIEDMMERRQRQASPPKEPSKQP